MNVGRMLVWLIWWGVFWWACAECLDPRLGQPKREGNRDLGSGGTD